MAGTWLFGFLLLYEMVHVSFFFSLSGGTEIVNAQGSDKKWYLTSWNKYIDIKSCHL